LDSQKEFEPCGSCWIAVLIPATFIGSRGITTRAVGWLTVDVVTVAVTPVTPHPTALVQNEIVAVAVVTARLPNLRNSSNGIRGACVTAALLARIPYERVEVQIVAVAVSQ
jgi:hypothetical protein